MAYVSWESRSGSRAARAYDDSRLRAVRQQAPCGLCCLAEGEEAQEGEVLVWTILSVDGNPVYWNPSWDAAVTWAIRQGGDLDVLFQAHFHPGPDQLVIQGDVDVHGDMA